MSKSKRYRRHFLDEQLEIIRGIRKPMPPPTKVILTFKDIQKQRKWDWRDQIEKIEEEEK